MSDKEKVLAVYPDAFAAFLHPDGTWMIRRGVKSSWAPLCPERLPSEEEAWADAASRLAPAAPIAPKASAKSSSSWKLPLPGERYQANSGEIFIPRSVDGNDVGEVLYTSSDDEYLHKVNLAEWYSLTEPVAPTALSGDEQPPPAVAPPTVAAPAAVEIPGIDPIEGVTFHKMPTDLIEALDAAPTGERKEPQTFEEWWSEYSTSRRWHKSQSNRELEIRATLSAAAWTASQARHDRVVERERFLQSQIAKVSMYNEEIARLGAVVEEKDREIAELREHNRKLTGETFSERNHAALQSQLAKLREALKLSREALELIADPPNPSSSQVCECEHNTEDCCALTSSHCPMCIASVALKGASE